MWTSMLAFRLFPTGDPNDNKGWWRFICLDMAEVPPTSSTTELHCLQTVTSASIQPSIFHLRRLKCFHRSDLPLVVRISAYSIACARHVDWWEVLSLQGTSALSDVLSGNNQVYHNGQPHWNTILPVKHTGKTSINHQLYFYLWFNEFCFGWTWLEQLTGC